LDKGSNNIPSRPENYLMYLYPKISEVKKRYLGIRDLYPKDLHMLTKPHQSKDSAIWCEVEIVVGFLI